MDQRAADWWLAANPLGQIVSVVAGVRDRVRAQPAQNATHHGASAPSVIALGESRVLWLLS